ncbi:CshA/CshB family fibrillar adhesin-related protein [Schaalia canis]|uniref:LPXTG cell wall anchor domain-containing protein n=1 Tax=Schaalia canis TaxID=100469 RepID=A0A3P1SE54_9ACTO|nr:CshA/CshB family fibrillar adhesin-related protein [Schaalia canis]RRC95581.1 hypothetical protein EII11_04735 [Schaalia canis]
MKHGKRDSRLALSLRARAHQPRRSILRSSFAAFLTLSMLAALNSSFAIDIALERDSDQAQSAQSDIYRAAVEGDDAREPGIHGHDLRDQEPGGTSDDHQVPSQHDEVSTGSKDGENEGASSPDVSGAPVGDANEATEEGSAAETVEPQKDEGSEVAGEKKPEESPAGYSGFFRARQPSGTSAVPRDPSILPAVFAKGGSGRYKEWIQWLQWGNYNDDFAGTSRPDVPVLNYGRPRTIRNYRDFGTSGYLLTQCTLSNLTYHSARSGVPDVQARGPLVATVPGAWAGDVLDNLYNSGKGGQWSSGGEVRASWETYPEHYTNLNEMVIGLANGYAYNGNGSIAGQKYTASGFSSEVSFNIQCSAELVEPSGQKRNIPLNGLVFADAEASSAYDGGDRDEWIQAYAWNPGTKWRVLDTLRSDGCPTFARGSYLDADINSTQLLRLIPSGKECVYQNQGRYRTPSGVGGPGAVMFMEGANGATIRMQGSGYSAVALGMVIASDFGDAPSSYGIAGSLFQPKWSAGQPANNSTHEAHVGANLMETRPATVIPGPTRLGQLIDADSRYSASAGADQDDQSGQQPSDEDALNAGELRTEGILVGPGGTLTKDVPCQGPGKVAGWIDWNRDGHFNNPNERSNVVTCSGSKATLVWTVPSDVKRSVAGEPGSANTYMRLRIADVADDNQMLPTGVTTAGEVEDYELRVYVPTVTLEKTVSAPWASNPLPASSWTLQLRHRKFTGAGYFVTGNGRTAETPVSASLYTLTENSNAPEAVAYEAGQWVCSEAPGSVKPPSQRFQSVLVAADRLRVAGADRVLCRVMNTTKPASLAWQKTNKATGAHLGGSSWTLRGPSHPSGVTVEDCISGACGGLDKDNRPGFFKVTQLKWGDYTVQELAAPAGFRKDGRTHHFPHMVDGIIDVALPAPIPNAPNDTPIIWRKVDASPQASPLSGSEWTLQRGNAAALTVADCVADAPSQCAGPDKDHRGGYFRVLVRDEGAYTLTETAAPIGYRRSREPIRRNISAQELGTQIDLGAIQNFAITPPALPFTGGTSADTFFIAGGGILAAAMLAAAYRRRQTDA